MTKTISARQKNQKLIEERITVENNYLQQPKIDSFESKSFSTFKR